MTGADEVYDAREKAALDAALIDEARQGGYDDGYADAELEMESVRDEGYDDGFESGQEAEREKIKDDLQTIVYDFDNDLCSETEAFNAVRELLREIR